jgi:hypothetical protein
MSFYLPPVFLQVTHQVEGDNVNIQITTPDPSPPPSDGNFSSPNYVPLPDEGDCLDCTQPRLIFSDPFYVYAVEKFSDKFPFDILGDLPSPPPDCPNLVVSLNGSSFSAEFCFVRDCAAFLKYIAWIGFAVLLVVHI